MVVQGIKDRSEIREDKVTRKQGYRDEGETREMKPGEDPGVGVHGWKRRSGEDPGKIHRSMGVQCSGVSEEKEVEVGGTRVRTSEGGGSLGCLVGSDEGD